MHKYLVYCRGFGDVAPRLILQIINVILVSPSRQKFLRTPLLVTNRKLFPNQPLFYCTKCIILPSCSYINWVIFRSLKYLKNKYIIFFFVFRRYYNRQIDKNNLKAEMEIMPLVFMGLRKGNFDDILLKKWEIINLKIFKFPIRRMYKQSRIFMTSILCVIMM